MQDVGQKKKSWIYFHFRNYIKTNKHLNPQHSMLPWLLVFQAQIGIQTSLLVGVEDEREVGVGCLLNHYLSMTDRWTAGQDHAWAQKHTLTQDDLDSPSLKWSDAQSPFISSESKKWHLEVSDCAPGLPHISQRTSWHQTQRRPKHLKNEHEKINLLISELCAWACDEEGWKSVGEESRDHSAGFNRGDTRGVSSCLWMWV